MICWLIGKKCLSVNSFGSLKYFKKENAPDGSTEYCFDCPHQDTCKYNCFYLYNNEKYEKIAGLAKHGRLGDSEEEINKNLKNPENLLARCVFHCDNNVVDNQIVNMHFEDNIVAQLKSIAFTNDLRRLLTIHGTEGMVYFSPAGKREVIIEKLNGEKTVCHVEEPVGGYAHHGGGDVGIISQFIEYLETGKPTKNITDITTSVMGHKVEFLAEESRLNGGKTYYL